MRAGLGLLLLLISSSLWAAPTSLPFDDKPYTLDLSVIQKQDPEALELETFSPDQSDSQRVKGLRIISSGRNYPYVYEMISIVGVGSDTLELVSKSLDGHPDVILKEFVPCRFAERCLHYTQRFSVGGKPHHVSSNYILIKGNALIHFAALSYGPEETHLALWGDAAADADADREVQVLIGCATLK